MSERRRIGLLLPSVNTTIEPDLYRALPPGVTVHSHRLWSQSRVWADERADDEQVGIPSRFVRLDEDVDGAVRYLATARLDAIVYACTSGSFVRGRGGEVAMCERIERLSGLPAVVTMAAVLDAMRAFKARRITVLSPYSEATNRRLRAFLTTDDEFDVLAVRADPKASTGSDAITTEDPADILEFATRSCLPGSDLLLCSCTAWRAFEVVTDLEQRLGIPVVTSNQATLWATLGRLGMAGAVSGHGRLFSLDVPLIPAP